MTEALVPTRIPEAYREEWAALSVEEREELLAIFGREVEATRQDVKPTFTRIKFPTSGSPAFTIPDLAGGEDRYVPDFAGIVIYQQRIRTYYPPDAPVGHNPPTCSSVDCKVPLPGPDAQAVTCKGCRHSQWNSGKNGRGQACKERLNVFLLRGGSEIPDYITLPPTALKTFSSYATDILKRKLVLSAVETVFGLAKAQNQDGTEYRALTLRYADGGRLVPLAAMCAASRVRERFIEEMQRRGVEEATTAADEPSSDTPGVAWTEGAVLDVDGSPIPF